MPSRHTILQREVAPVLFDWTNCWEAAGNAVPNRQADNALPPCASRLRHRSTACSGTCADVTSDASNCGSCGVTCDTSNGEFCSAECACPAPVPMPGPIALAVLIRGPGLGLNLSATT